MQAIIDFFRGLLTLGGSFDWNTVRTNLFDAEVIEGAKITVILAVLSQAIGSLIGLLLYLLRRSGNVVVRGLAEIYIWFFRGTPLLVQILFLYGLFPALHLVRTVRAHDFFASIGFPDILLEAFLPALIAFSLNEGAYMAEIVRAGIDSIDVGQMEAGKSLGMTYGQAMRRIILPQATRVILPPLGNEFNNMLKTTSLASTIGLLELYQVTHVLAFESFQILAFAVVASIWYLAMTTVWGFVQSWLERRFNASNLDSPQNASLLDRMLGRGNKSVSPATVAQETLLNGGRR
jgi:polar amino acid transport system permease protein